MAQDRFLIGPLKHGLQKNVKPFMIADSAYELLDNAYLYEGTIRKRFGTELMIPINPPVAGYESLVSRLRINVGTTDVNGKLYLLAPNGIPGAPFEVGAMLSITGAAGTDIFTVTALGTPAVLLTNGAATEHTLNTTNGELKIDNSAQVSSAVYFYPATPVMGFITDESSTINYKETYAFDTHFAYYFTANGWERRANAVPAAPDIWSGTDSDFFQGDVFRGTSSQLDTLYVVNGADTVRYWDPVASQWNALVPVYNAAGDTITSANIVIAFKNRLLLMNVIQTAAGAVRYKSRIRYSQNGSPIPVGGVVDQWREDVPGRGSWIDLPVQEAIIAAQHLRDKLIIYCERSTWELVYTGNEIGPFLFQQINTELGAESRMSQVPFDSAVLAVSNVGIHACNGNSVTRIDELIPTEVFRIDNENNGVKRVAGIRDYYLEQVYWTYPTSKRDGAQVYPNKIVAFNYGTKTWANFDDSVTAFGFIQEGYRNLTWAELIAPLTWATWTEPWGTVTPEQTPRNRNIIAGNQQGFTFIANHTVPTNAAGLAISGIPISAVGPIVLLVKDHNLQQNDFVYIENCQGATELNKQIFKVIAIDAALVNSVTIQSNVAVAGTYLGGGTLSRVSKINILTKQYNFYKDKGMGINLIGVDFNVDRTTDGAITIDYSMSTSYMSMVDLGAIAGAALGSSVLETSPYDLVPLEGHQQQLWHPLYFNAEGECVQLRLFMSDTQMFDIKLREADFQLNMMVFYTSPSGRI